MKAINFIEGSALPYNGYRNQLRRPLKELAKDTKELAARRYAKSE